MIPIENLTDIEGVRNYNGIKKFADFIGEDFAKRSGSGDGDYRTDV